jgi:uroporphyrinogen decarboxylase
MAQTSYEVIKRAVSFNDPDRIPVMMPCVGVNDAHNVRWNQIGTGDLSQKQTVDEWGCTWARSEMSNMGQVKGYPLEDWSALDRYRWPDPDSENFYAGMESRFEGSRDKFVLTGIFMLLFERMHSLHGFANTLMDLASGDERVEMLADRIVDYDIAIIQNIARRFPGQIHGLTFSDDWGTEQNTFISPRLWRSFFKPRYKRIFDTAHDAGWVVWMHSCGQIAGIVDDLIETGVDVLNLQQPRVFGIEAFGRRFAGRVAFETLCDIQVTLPFQGKAAIAEEARLLVEHWSTASGGFILGDYGNSAAIGVEQVKKHWMLEAFMAVDRWRKEKDEQG